MHNFIAIEGIDGCGKTTQVKMLADYFKKNKKKAPTMLSIFFGMLFQTVIMGLLRHIKNPLNKDLKI